MVSNDFELQEILCISEGRGHKVHRTWFKGVGDHRVFSKKDGFLSNFKRMVEAFKISREYDVLICEDGSSSRTGIVWKFLSKIRRDEATLIRIFGDSGVHNSLESDFFLTKEDIGYRFLDGGIAVSDILKQDIESNYNVNVRAVYPMILGLDFFSSVSVDRYDTQDILFVGANHDFKNIESLVEAVEGLDVTLHLVGSGHKEYEQENVQAHGYVDDLSEVMENCDLYIQPSTYEAFGVAPCEAMAAGIPAIVTDKTGCKPFVEEVDPELVTEGSDPEDIREKIEYYYDLSEEERRGRGEKAREAVSELTEENQVRKFKDALQELIQSS